VASDEESSKKRTNHKDVKLFAIVEQEVNK
jgi:hypothetical protein